MAGVFKGRNTTWADGTLDPYGEQAANEPYVFLDQSYPAVVGNSWVVLKAEGTTASYTIKDATDVSKADFALSAKVTRLQLDTHTSLSDFGIRETTAFANNEELPLAPMPIVEPVSGSAIELEGWVEGLFTGQMLIICGELQRCAASAHVRRSPSSGREHQVVLGGGTRIEIPALDNAYVRHTVTIFGNVALATHGETVEELLGSGDASQPTRSSRFGSPPHLCQSRQSDRRGVHPRGAGERRAVARVPDTCRQKSARPRVRDPDRGRRHHHRAVRRQRRRRQAGVGPPECPRATTGEASASKDR